MSPNVWPAGTSFDVTITGSGFGTNPLVSLSGVGVAINSQSGASDTQVTVNVSVAADAPSENVTVQVQSTGYLGNGFMPTQTGQPSAGSNTATVAPIPAPEPVIVSGPNTQGAGICQTGTQLPQTAQAVFAGQQVGFTGCVPANVISMIASESWQESSNFTNAAIAGYTASNSSGSVTPLAATNCGTAQNCDFNTFYFIAPGTYTFAYLYTLANGQSNGTVATFNVLSPAPPSTGPAVSVNIGSATIEPMSVDPNTHFLRIDPLGIPTLILLGPPVPGGGEAGIVFQAFFNPPSGNTGIYQWVQLVDSDTLKSQDSNGRGACTSNADFPSPSESQLDGPYPYRYTLDSNNTLPIQNDMATDNPTFPKANAAELARSFSATMNLMWVPTPASGCSTVNGQSCTIPVPLGSINQSAPWYFAGDAINTLDPSKGIHQTTWIMNYDGQPPTPAFQASNPAGANNGYPVWSTSTLYLGGLSCP